MGGREGREEEREGGREGEREAGEEGGEGGREGGGEEDIQCVICVPNQSHLVSLRHMTHNYL